MKDHPSLRLKLIKVRHEDVRKTYKKLAITEAIAASSGELVITTDADCRRGDQWLSTLAGYYKIHHPEMISAPVIFEGETSWLEKFQSLEFLGLIAIGAAAINNKMPFLCNGANLAFTKKIFNEAGGYEANKNLSSGDDTQLMRKIAIKGKDQIHFVKSMKAVVTTKAKKSAGELLSQRKRWASKIPAQMNFFTLLIAVIAFFLHAGLFLSALAAVYNGNVAGFLIPLAIKMIPEFILLTNVSVFFKKSGLLYLFLPAQVIYPVYISFVGLSSLSGTYQWKGREVK
jgi:cellulose synthase/poly-beta-1,6-N-acetylglucosamine synthase-like glycosyltransferase